MEQRVLAGDGEEDADVRGGVNQGFQRALLILFGDDELDVGVESAELGDGLFPQYLRK